MFIKNIKLINFKNYKEAEFTFSQKITCFTGLNGVGKTNLLDAVHYLSLTKSFFNASDSGNIKFGQDFFVIQGTINKNDTYNKLYCGFKKGKKKKFTLNDNAYKKFSNHIGLFPIVMVSPSDASLITGTGEERRKYIDSVISQYDKSYLSTLIKYNRILDQRNKLLKNFAKKQYFDKDTIEVYNEQLVVSGNVIHKKRKDFIDQLLPLFNDFYNYISKNKETVRLKYKSQLNDDDFANLLAQNLAKDRILQYTSTGIHRDDILMQINEHVVKKSASQGQQKSFLISLKLAQFDFIKNSNNIKPILLLDDIFDKFDKERITQIIELTSQEKFGQIFITDTNSERVKSILSGKGVEYQLYEIINKE